MFTAIEEKRLRRMLDNPPDSFAPRGSQSGGESVSLDAESESRLLRQIRNVVTDAVLDAIEELRQADAQEDGKGKNAAGKREESPQRRVRWI